MFFVPGADGYVSGIAYLGLATLGVAIGNAVMKYLAHSMDAIMAMGFQLLIGDIPLAIAAYLLEDTSAVQWSAQFGFVLISPWRSRAPRGLTSSGSRSSGMSRSAAPTRGPFSSPRLVL